MVRQDTCRLSPNGNGAQTYIGQSLLGDTACPLTAGKETSVNVIDGVGLLFIRPHDPRDLSVEVDDSTSPPTATVTFEPEGDDEH